MLKSGADLDRLTYYAAADALTVCVIPPSDPDFDSRDSRRIVNFQGRRKARRG